jgi:hypothetical protein
MYTHICVYTGGIPKNTFSYSGGMKACKSFQNSDTNFLTVTLPSRVNYEWAYKNRDLTISKENIVLCKPKTEKADHSGCAV